jgi:hypothetical protein
MILYDLVILSGGVAVFATAESKDPNEIVGNLE